MVPWMRALEMGRPGLSPVCLEAGLSRASAASGSRPLPCTPVCVKGVTEFYMVRESEGATRKRFVCEHLRGIVQSHLRTEKLAYLRLKWLVVVSNFILNIHFHLWFCIFEYFFLRRAFLLHLCKLQALENLGLFHCVYVSGQAI